MNDGDEHEVPRPKLVRTGCRLFWHRDWVWEGDTRGEWSIAESEILWGERGYISMKWGLERWWVMMMMPLSFLYNSNFMRWMTNYLYEMRLEWIVVWCRDVLCFLYNWNFMWWTTNYLYEMGFVWIVVWCRDATQMSLQFKFHEMNHQLSLWNGVCMNSCVMSWCHSDVSTIQISWDEPPTISMKWS